MDIVYNLYKLRGTRCKVSSNIIERCPVSGEENGARKSMHAALDAFLDNENLGTFVLSKIPEYYEPSIF